VKFVERHPFADPDVAARKLVEIANGVEARLAAAPISSAPLSTAPLLSVGLGGTRAGLT
jgi:hypothetical protein